jgi:hypothetical protein
MGFINNSRGIRSCVSGTPSFVGQFDSYVSDLRQGEVPSSVRRSSISITEKNNIEEIPLTQLTPGFYSRLMEISIRKAQFGGQYTWKNTSSDRSVGLHFEMGNRKVTVPNREIYHRSHSPGFLGNQEETRIKPWCQQSQRNFLYYSFQ